MLLPWKPITPYQLFAMSLICPDTHLGGPAPPVLNGFPMMRIVIDECETSHPYLLISPKLKFDKRLWWCSFIASKPLWPNPNCQFTTGIRITWQFHLSDNDLKLTKNHQIEHVCFFLESNGHQSNFSTTMDYRRSVKLPTCVNRKLMKPLWTE